MLKGCGQGEVGVDEPIFKPEDFSQPNEVMLAEVHKAMTELRQEVHELRLAVVEQSRIQQRLLEGDGK
jgi:hypothetical protein